MSPKMQQRAWVRDEDEAESTPSTNSQYMPPLAAVQPVLLSHLVWSWLRPCPSLFHRLLLRPFPQLPCSSPCRTHGLTQAFVTPLPTGPEGEDICRVGKDQTPGQNKAVLSLA